MRTCRLVQAGKDVDVFSAGLFGGVPAQQFDSVSGPRLPAVLGSAGSGATVIFTPLVSLPHGKGCPQHRGTTRRHLYHILACCSIS